jgi:hypothetical protein
LTGVTLLMGVVVVPANGALTRTDAASAGGKIAAAEAPMTIRRFNAASAPDPRVLFLMPSITAHKPFVSQGAGYADRTTRRGDLRGPRQ